MNICETVAAGPQANRAFPAALQSLHQVYVGLYRHVQGLGLGSYSGCMWEGPGTGAANLEPNIKEIIVMRAPKQAITSKP